MKISESALWKWIVKNNPDPKAFHFERLENLVGSGIPDVVHKHKEGETIWIELKTARKPVRPTSKIFKKGYFNKSQEVWHKKWSGLGAKVYILLGVDKERYLISTIGIESAINDFTYSDIQKYKIDDIFLELYWIGTTEY